LELAEEATGEDVLKAFLEKDKDQIKTLLKNYEPTLDSIFQKLKGQYHTSLKLSGIPILGSRIIKPLEAMLDLIRRYESVTVNIYQSRWAR